MQNKEEKNFKLCKSKIQAHTRHSMKCCTRCYKSQQLAVSYCQNCMEYLCGQCRLNHRQNKIFKDHTIRDVETITFIGCAIPCSKHMDKAVAIYCRSDCELICSECFKTEHYSCSIDYIPEMSSDFVESKEYQSKLEQMETYIETCDKICNLIDDRIAGIIHVNVSVLKDIETFRNRQENTDKEFEEWEKDILEQAATVRRSNIEQMQNIFDSCAAMKKEICALLSHMRTLPSENQQDRLFIELIQAYPKLDKWDKKLRKHYNKGKVLNIKFVPFSLIEPGKGFGMLQELPIKTLSSNDDAITLTFTKTIGVKTIDDDNSCMITGVAQITTDILLLVDWRNKAAKSVDVMACEVRARLQMDSAPWDVVALPDNKAAITLPDDKCILFLSTEKGLSKPRVIKVDGTCTGIAYGRGQLVVAFRDPGKCQLLTMQGEVIWTSGLEVGLSNCIHHVAVSKDENSIIVSDFDYDNVKKLNWKGEVTGRYDHDDMEWSMGIVPCHDGSFFVCSKGNDTIHKVSTDCLNIQIIGKGEDQLTKTNTFCFNEDNNMMYTCSGYLKDPYFDNTIKVFKVYSNNKS